MATIPLEKLTNEELEKILAEGVAKDIAHLHSLGLPTAHGDNNGVYLIYPDGRKVYIKDNDKEEETN